MKNKKIISVVLTLAILLGFGLFALGSSSTNDSSEDKEIKNVENAETDKAASDDSDKEETEAPKQEKEDATIEEQVLVDQDDVIITAKSMSVSLFGPEMDILIENNSDTNLCVQVRNASVNGFMVDTMISEDVAAGKKSNTSITFSSQALSECGITKFAEIEFSFHVFREEDWETYFDSEVINVKTSLYDSHEQVIDDSGEVIYDKDGIKIVGKGLSSNESIFGPGLIIYIENNSDKDITVQVRDTSINGFMIETIMSEDVVVGKKAITAVTFLSTDLEENGITDIESIETSFHVFDMNSWDVIVDTDPITINF